jgi:4-hydroxybenzoyl-CoA thioesterase
MVFERAKRIRFSHCDPAGIVFYPRYAELLNEVVEDWFADGLGVDLRTLIGEHRLGVPVVRLETDFLAPARFGDTLTFRLAVSTIGGSSLQLAVEAVRGDVPCLRAVLKMVLTSLDSFRAVPIDDQWREKFAAYLAESR